MEYKVETIEETSEVTVVSSVVYSYPAHIHTYSEMILYEPFDGMVIVNDQQIWADSGCAVLIVPSDLHRVVVNQSRNAKFIKIAFISQRNDSSAAMEGLEKETFLSEIFAEIRNCGKFDHYARLLTETAECILQTKGRRIPSLKKNVQKDLAVQAVRIIKDHGYRQISLRSVAEMLFVSAPHLSRVFKQTIGVGFSCYLTELRLDRAASLLCKTSKSVTEICMESGFNNLSNFIRRFKQRYGCSPAVFRRRKTGS